MSANPSTKMGGLRGDGLRIPDNLTAVRLISLGALLLSAAAIPPLIARGQFSGRTIGTYSLLWVVLLGITFALSLAELVLTVLVWGRAQPGQAKQAQRALTFFSRLGAWNGLGLLAPFAAYVLLILYRYQKHFADFVPQVWLFWLAAAVGAFFLTAAWKKTPYGLAFIVVAIFYGAGVKALGYLPDISAYPFSLSWSEASRYYYASLPYSRQLYGFQIPLSFLHPSRYLLMSMAYWAPDAGLLFHRLWQVTLWIGLSGLTGLTLARRLQWQHPLKMVAAAVWAALFLLQDPVYYHLLVCVILVLVGFDVRRPWRTLIFVVLGSIWAGISRVNWLPVPAMIAVSLYLLEKPICAVRDPRAVRRLARYLWSPALWTVMGVAAGVIAQLAYALVSGHEDKSGFTSSFTSDLLWYRLLPSPTYPLGVAVVILLVSAPLLALVLGNWLGRRVQWHPLRTVGLIGMLVVLLIGGLVVSTKIGGGSNIHNLDAFSTLLLIVGCAVAAGRYASETGGPPQPWRPWPLLLVGILLPVIWAINVGDPFVRRDFAQADYDLSKLNAIVEQYAPQGDVLFITQRQLAIFKLVPGVRMVPDYELITLTEMAISNNQPYLDRFYQDLRSHRFALIVADRQQDLLKDPRLDAFAEENNAWVIRVSRPLMQYYQEKTFFDTQGIQLLVPR